MPKSKTPKKHPKPAPERRHPKQLAPLPPLSRWLYSRRTTAGLLDTSVDTVKELERQGILTPIRMTGPRGQVHYSREQVSSVAKGGDGKPRPAKTIT